MRLGYKKFKEIKKWYGSSDFEIGYDTNALTIRFGYWRSIDIDGLKKILPFYLTITENLVDDDDDCGEQQVTNRQKVQLSGFGLISLKRIWKVRQSFDYLSRGPRISGEDAMVLVGHDMDMYNSAQI